MKFTGSIKNRLITIILSVALLTSLIGYGSFVYWYMNIQQKQSLKLAKTVGEVLGQNIAKLIYLNDISAAADISSQLKSFKQLNTMVLYKLNKQAIFQYSKNNKTFKTIPLPNKQNRIYKVNSNNLTLYIDANYQNTHLGYVQFNFKISSIMDIIKENINMLISILLIMFILSFILASYFARKFTNPILNLVEFLEKIEAIESFDRRVIINENNEYGKLYEEVNTMLERIKVSQEALAIAAVSFETQNGITITDKHNNILRVNKAFTKITGYEPTDVIGLKPSMLKSDVQDNKFYIDMYNQLNKYNFWSGEITNKHKDGHLFKEFLTINVVLDKYGQIQNYVASFIDITSQKEIEKQLKEKDDMLVQKSKMATMGEMLENIAHQWRQPLSLISTISSSLVLNKELGVAVKQEDEIEKLNKINDTTQYLSQTIDDFRDFFKPNKTKQHINLEKNYKKTLALVNSKFAALDINVIENIEQIEVETLDNELMQVVMNILNNAKDILQTKENQKRYIFIDIFKDNEFAIINIKDNAGGIPKNIINKIFDPYFTTKHKAQGTGIGLYMSKEMIHKHIKGSLEVENIKYTYNEIEYSCASFCIKIPLK